MAKIILTTESCSDLSKELLEEKQILSVPFSVNFPDRTVYDGEIPIQEIYDYYQETKKFLKQMRLVLISILSFLKKLPVKIQQVKLFISAIHQRARVRFKMP